MPKVLLVRPGAGSPDLLPLEAWRALTTARAFAAPGDVLAQRLREAGYEVGELVPQHGTTTDLKGTNLLAHSHGQVSPAARARAGELATLAIEHDEVAFICNDEDLVRAVMDRALDGDLEVEIVVGRHPRGHRLLELVNIEARLRAPDGCPWDAEQTHQSLAKHLIDETYELLEAIETGTREDLVEELGDLLLQVIFHAQIGVDEGTFDIDDVAQGIVTKLVDRHPWVFGDAEVDGAEGALEHWDQIKRTEKGGGLFDGVTDKLPALAYAQKLLRRAQAAGADRDELEPHGLAKAADAIAAGEEPEVAFGDLLLWVARFARAVDVDAESALRRAARAYRDRLAAD
jgi:XTP/dITP diphosphohydrolase